MSLSEVIINTSSFSFQISYIYIYICNKVGMQISFTKTKVLKHLSPFKRIVEDCVLINNNILIRKLGLSKFEMEMKIS